MIKTHHRFSIRGKNTSLKYNYTGFHYIVIYNRCIINYSIIIKDYRNEWLYLVHFTLFFNIPHIFKNKNHKNKTRNEKKKKAKKFLPKICSKRCF